MLDSEKVINGSFGEVWMEGQWLVNFNHLEAAIEKDKREIKRAGTRWTGHKVVGLKGTGTISGFKVTSEMLARFGAVADDTKVDVKTELVSKLADPEAYGHERVRLKNVSFDRVPLANWTAGEEVTEEWPFTFEGYELLDPIKEL